MNLKKVDIQLSAMSSTDQITEKFLVVISHIKFHFKVERNSLFNQKKCLCNDVKRKNQHKTNFCIVKVINFTFIIFTSGHINVCKAKRQSDIKKGVKVFFDLFNLKKHHLKKNPVIDNITCKGNLHHPVLLSKFYFFFNKLKANKKKELFCSYNYLCFPALYCEKINKKGKILLFHSGKFSVVGVQTYSHIRNLVCPFLALMKKYWKQTNQRPCALTAV